MNAQSLFRLVIVISLIALFMTGFLHYVLGNNKPVDNAFANSFVFKMNHELQQLYWQWQKQGRPNSVQVINNKTERKTTLQMNQSGQPILGNGKLNPEVCANFVGTFIGQETLNKGWQVSTTYWNEAENSTSVKSSACKYEVLNKVFIYVPNTGKFKEIR